jgi:hypothetical protein
MGNYSDTKHKHVIKINEKNVEKKLTTLMGNIDSDYETLAPIIVPRIIKNKKTLQGKIKALMNFTEPTEKEKEQDEYFADSVFLLNNSSYCSGFDYKITPIKTGEVLLSLFYTT